MPFVFKWKDKIKPKSINASPISNLDLFPTLLEVANIDTAPYSFDGQSLLSVLKSVKNIDQRPLYWHFPIYLEAYNKSNNQNRDSLFRTRPGSVVRLGDWKLHQYFENNDLELYNLKNDIGEQHNLINENRQKAEELLSLLNKWRMETNAPIPHEMNPKFAQ